MKKKIGLIAPCLRNTRKTVAVSSVPPKGLRSFFAPWRRAAAPFALAVALFAALQPLAAQERGYGNHERFYDGRGNFAYRNDYRGERDWRAREYREQVLRDRAFREHEWRERFDRGYGYGYGYRAPVPYVGFQFYGR